MTKRIKIIALTTSLVLCLSLFAVGVLAATSATFNVTSTLNFEADGVYIMVDASLKQGSSVTGATLSNGENITENTYIGYSYPREANQDYPNGEASTSYFVNESGVQDNDWTIGQIDYSTENTVVVYEFSVSNYSNFDVAATITTNLANIISASSGQLSVATYKNSVQDGTASYSFNIPARTNETTPGTITYQIAVTLNTFMSGFTTEEISMSFLFEEAISIPDVNFNYFDISGNVINDLTSEALNSENNIFVVPGYSSSGEPLELYSQYTHPSEPGSVTQKPAPIMKSYPFSNLNNVNTIYLLDGLTSIGDFVFENCSNITEFILGDSITRIGASAFSNCTEILNINLPNSLIYIGDFTFSGCSKLKNLVIHDSVEVIGHGAFRNCTNLINIVLPNSLKQLGDGAFDGCVNLSSVTINDGLEEIGTGVFNNCTSLTSITVNSIIPPTACSILMNNFSLFDDNTPVEHIYVPAESVEAYKTATGWSKYADLITAIS